MRVVVSGDGHVRAGERAGVVGAGYGERRAGFGGMHEAVYVGHCCRHVRRCGGREARIRGGCDEGRVRYVGRTVALDVRAYRRRRVLPNPLVEGLDERLRIHLLFNSGDRRRLSLRNVPGVVVVITRMDGGCTGSCSCYKQIHGWSGEVASVRRYQSLVVVLLRLEWQIARRFMEVVVEASGGLV